MMGTTTTKQRYPLADAEAVAFQILFFLSPCCERICIAGSIRRRKATVGDIEIVYVPKMERIRDPDNMFASLLAPMTDTVIRDFQSTGFMERRLNIKGVATYGPRNKLMRHVASEIGVDLFATTADCWFNYLVCRTGGAASNVAIATAAQRLGWKWNPYGPGFSRFGDIRPMPSEEAVFAFVGLPFKASSDRE